MDILKLMNGQAWPLIVVFFLFTVYLYTVWKQSLFKRLGIPGPIPFPLLGMLKDFAIKGVGKADQEVVTKYGDIIGVYTGCVPTLLVSDVDMIKEIFVKEYQTFTNRVELFKPEGILADMITNVEDNHWKFLRGTLTPTFTTRKLKIVLTVEQVRNYQLLRRFKKEQAFECVTTDPDFLNKSRNFDVLEMVNMVQRCCSDLIENISKQSAGDKNIDMMEVCGSYTMDVVCSTVFGLHINSQKEPDNEFIKNVKKTIFTSIVKPYFIIIFMFPILKNTISSFLSRSFFGDGAETFFRKVVKQLIEDRKAIKNNKFKDVIQIMLNSRNDLDKGGVLTELGALDFSHYKNRGLSENEIIANSIVFFAAGYDTMANTLAFTVYELARNQCMQERLIDEIDREVAQNAATYDVLSKMQYLDMFLSEVLRLYAPVQRINRMTKNDITINGIFIPKGVGVSIPISALHRKPNYWPDPEKFDPERFTAENKSNRPMYAYIPFGLGPRACIGMRFAFIQAKLATISMLQNFRFHACVKTEIPIVLDKGFMTRPKNGVHVAISRR